MFVSQVYDEFKAQVGDGCSASAVLGRMSDALRLIMERFPDAKLNHQVMDICTCGGIVTLPSFVEVPVAINQAGHPTVYRDVWYQHHLNGMGVTGSTNLGYVDELGCYFTFRDIQSPSYLVAVTENPADNNRSFRVYGDDENDLPIRTKDSTGVEREGFLVPLIYGSKVANSLAPPIKRITRIYSDLRAGRVTLIAVDAKTNVGTTIGIYEPNETEPRYTRIRVSTSSSWVRMTYRRKTMDLTSVYDWIPLDNRLVLILAGKAVREMLDGRVQEAQVFLGQAFAMFENSELSKVAPSLSSPQIIDHQTREGGTSLLYS